MKARALVVSVAVVGFGVAALCCAPQDVVVANVHDGGIGEQNDAKPFGTTCMHNEDCDSSSYCERATCGDATGVCQVLPPFCDDTQSPVCGCDGVTFWNDCLRRSRGETSSIAGPCMSGAAECGGMMRKQCDIPGARCAKLLRADATCDGPQDMIPGHCWVLPFKCPAPDPMEDKWEACGLPDAGSGPIPPMDCRGFCDAIRSSAPFKPTFSPTCM
jgi:hypothetical protein